MARSIVRVTSQTRKGGRVECVISKTKRPWVKEAIGALNVTVAFLATWYAIKSSIAISA
jgi:hypothetical protein